MKDIIKDNKLIDEVLYQYKGSLKQDLERYRNHVFRVFNFAVYLAREDFLDRDKLSIALAFHDLGIWTHSTFNYLDPSVELARRYLEDRKKTEWIDEISLMIDMHHKITEYTGKYAESVEVIRKADLVDVSLGVYRFSIPEKFVEEVKLEFPNLGFHSKLFQLGLGSFFKAPFNPLPMFKK
jgi:hypothetical protein